MRHWSTLPTDLFSKKEPLIEDGIAQDASTVDENSWKLNGAWSNSWIYLIFLVQHIYLAVLAHEGILNASKLNSAVSLAAIYTEILLAIALVAILLSILWTTVLIRFAYFAIISLFFYAMAVEAWFTYTFYTTGKYVLGASFLISVVAVALNAFIAFIQKRRFIIFATENLKVVSAAFYDNQSLIFIPCIVTIFQIMWFILYTFAVMGAETFDKSQTQTTVALIDSISNKSHWYWLAMLLSFLWTRQILLGIVNMTSAGVLGRWWHSKPSGSSSYENFVPVFKLACTKNLSSIAFSSFLNGICEKALVFATIKIHKSLAWLVEPVQHILACFSCFSTCCIGVYNIGFMAAGSKVLKMLKECGLRDAAVLSRFLSLSSFLIGNVVYLCCMFLIEPVFHILEDKYEEAFFGQDDREYLKILVGRIGYIMSFFISSTIVQTVGYLTNATVICFIENPHALQNNHPEEYIQAYDSWTKICPYFTAELKSPTVRTVVVSV